MLNNFIPEVYSDLLMMDRDKETVFAKLVNRDYEGEIAQMGDVVHITGLQDPTIRSYTKGATLAAEYLKDNTVDLVIDQANYFNVLLDDMDKKQAAGDPTPETIRRARLGFADAMDQYIAGMYGQAGTSISHTQVVSSNVISTLSSGLTKLRENSVPTSETVYLVASPRIAEKIMLADIVYNTDNSDTLNNGLIGRIKFLNMEVYTSVNIVTSANVDYCMMFTKQAISLAEQVPVGSIEKLRSPDTLADIVRGFHLFGAKVLKPKELVTLALKTGNESAV
jgi:hypothetical protein